MSKIVTMAKIGLSCLLCVQLNTLYAQSIPVMKQTHLLEVDPFIGTTKSAVLTHWGGNGGTYPGAVAPSGNIQLSPETRISGARGYDYTDHSIYYFSCIKHYSGFPEGSSGHLMVMPVQSGQNFEDGNYHRPFSHQDEQARPGYYRVMLKDDHTIVEATAGLRTGMFRFTFPGKVKPQVFIGDAGEISFAGKRVLQGTISHMVINFSEDLLDIKQVKGGYLLSFRAAVKGPKVIFFKLSTSTVSFASAQNNIDQEIKLAGFEGLKQYTACRWAKELATVDLTDPNAARKTTFYTALYHSLLIPWVISDADGRYRGADNKVHKVSGQLEYGGFSPWDTFRSLHPLLSLLYPQKQHDVILSMLDIYRQTGHLPTESMTGNHAVSIITDAWLKGITGYDKDLAYLAMKKNVMEAPFVQNDLEIYHQKGYVPFSSSESVTRTVEYAYDDWVLAQYAKTVMHQQQDYELLNSRGFNYRNLLSPASLFMLPRKDQEVKQEPGKSGYKEGDKWVYSYFVPHNAKDLVNLFGGKEEFAARLDSALRNDVIVYDNETVLHVPYLFNAAGYPNLTQQWIREIVTNRFSATPGGLPGNDDLGAMSSAYLFNAMGIFPISPGRPLYAIGAPLFQSMTLHLANHRNFTIEAREQSPQNKYVKSLLLNHQPYEQLVIAHATLMKGGMMQYTMSAAAQTWPKDKDPVKLSETTADAHIELLDYSVSQTKVNPDDQFWVRFRLSNTGSLGTKKVVVLINGKPFLVKHSLVLPGKILSDSISCRLYRIGKVKIALSVAEITRAGAEVAVAEVKYGHQEMSVEVVSPAIPAVHPFEISQFNYIPVIPLHVQQQISYQLKNLTGEDQRFSVPVQQGAQVLFNDTVALAPGEAKNISHQFKAEEPGIIEMKVATNGFSYKVYDTPASSLLLSLSMDSLNSGQIIDQSGLSNRAIIMAKSSDKTRPLLGDSCFVAVTPSPALNQLDESLTMMAWVYPQNNSNGLTDLFTKGDNHVLQTTGNQTLTFFAGGWGRGDCTVRLPANWTNHWHHIAGTCKGELLAVYIDGKLAGTSKVDGLVNLSGEGQWQIGRNEEFPGERVFHGFMDKVKIYKEALSAAEIDAIVISERPAFR